MRELRAVWAQTTRVEAMRAARRAEDGRRRGTDVCQQGAHLFAAALACLSARSRAELRPAALSARASGLLTA